MKGICREMSLVTVGDRRGTDPSDVKAEEGQKDKVRHDAAHHGETKVPPPWKETGDERKH